MEESRGEHSLDDAPEITVGAATSRGWESRSPVALDPIGKRWGTIYGDERLGRIVDGYRVSPSFC